MNKITLKFNKTLTSIAGYDFGEEIYKLQVKNTYKIEEENIIIFPNQIERVAISFIQGFVSELIKDFGYENMVAKMKIEGNPKVVKRFNEVI